MAKPFGDPWMALEKGRPRTSSTSPGGKYYGKLNQALWKLPFGQHPAHRRLRQEFKTPRSLDEPHRTEVGRDLEELPEPPCRATGCSGCVVDGITIDEKDILPVSGTSRGPAARRETSTRMRLDSTRAVTIRNCVIINPDGFAINVPPGSTIENTWS